MSAESTRQSSDRQGRDEQRLRNEILEILDENRLMSLATNRSDGWPQVTIVNYLRIGHALYFVVARDSQKFTNIARDSRVSIAVGGGSGRGAAVRGLSMAARVAEVVESYRIEEINRRIQGLPPEARFSPHPSSPSIAVLEARPQIVSVIDYATPPGRRDLVRIVEDWRVEAVTE